MSGRRKLTAETSKESERRLLLLNGSNGGGSGSMTLLGSAQHQRLINLAKTSGLVLCLLKSRLKLLLSHLQVLDVSGRSVQERHLA